jgi:hypothetical protein
MKLLNLYLIFISFNSGEHSNEAYSDIAEILDAIEQLFVGGHYDHCDTDAEFERVYRALIQQKQKEMKEAEASGSRDFCLEVEGTWATITFPKK